MFKPMMKTVLAAAAVALISSNAMAQAAAAASAPAAPVSEAKKALALKVVKLQQPSIEGLARNIVGQTAQQFLQLAGQQMGRVPQDKQKAVGEAIQADVKKFYDDVVVTVSNKAITLAPGIQTPVLTEKLTEEELKQVIAWLESSARVKMGTISQELDEALSKKIVEETRGEVEPQVRGLEKAITDRLKPYVAAASAPADAAAKPAKAASGASSKKKKAD